MGILDGSLLGQLAVWLVGRSIEWYYSCLLVRSDGQ
jgi:hypothetical protein